MNIIWSCLLQSVVCSVCFWYGRCSFGKLVNCTVLTNTMKCDFTSSECCALIQVSKLMCFKKEDLILYQLHRDEITGWLCGYKHCCISASRSWVWFLGPGPFWEICMFSMCFLSGYSSFLPQSKNMHIRLHDDSGLPIVHEYVYVWCHSLFVGPVTGDLSRAYPALALCQLGLAPASPRPAMHTVSGIDSGLYGWLDLLTDWCPYNQHELEK